MGLNLGRSFEQTHEQALPRSLELARELEETDDDEVIREKLGLLLDSISEDLHVQFVSNVSELYRGMQSENCLVRVEHLSRVLETLELEDSPLKISDENERHYANTVIPVPEGIKIALSEGEAPGPVHIIVGFGKTIIGFKSDNISVDEIEFSESDIRDAKERAYLCRHVSGILKKNDIRYMIIRIPFNMIREQYLTEEEKQKKPPFAFRGVRLDQSENG